MIRLDTYRKMGRKYSHLSAALFGAGLLLLILAANLQGGTESEGMFSLVCVILGIILIYLAGSAGSQAETNNRALRELDGLEMEVSK